MLIAGIVLGGTYACQTSESATSPAATAESPSAAPPPSAADTAATRPAEPPPAPHTVTYVVTGGKVVSGPRTVTAERDTELVVEVTSDRADELHVHGYDETLEVQPHRKSRLSFVVNIPGVFEVELHSGTKLCDLRID